MRLSRIGSHWLTRVPIGLAAVTCVVALTLFGTTWRSDAWYYDALLTYTGVHADDGIVIVAVDDKSLAALGRWPWPRSAHAHLLDVLRRTGARGVALDVLLTERDVGDGNGDAMLVEALRRNGNVVLPMAAEPSEPNGVPIEILPLPALQAAASGIGHAEVGVDRDGVSRRAYLHAGLGDAHWPALALALYRLDGRHRDMTLPGLRNPDAARASPYAWNRDYEVLIPYVSDGRGFQQVSYIDVLRGDVAPTLLRGRWLLVGVTADGVNDTVRTPLSGSGDRMTGVEYQANLLNMLIQRTAIVPFTPTRQLPFAIALVLLPVMLVGVRAIARRSWWLMPIVALLAFSLSAGLLFATRQWFPPFATIATLLLEFLLLATYRWRQSERLAHSDGLTGLANRRMFDIRLTRELAAAQRNGRPLSLLLIDVDHFKLYNDTYGHQAGDELLRLVARSIAAHTRRSPDLAARYGGDELSLLLPATPVQTARAIATGIVEEVRALAMPHHDSDVASIATVSIGIASTSQTHAGSEIGSLLERADAALYRAKQLGRNRSYAAPDRSA